MLISAGGFKNGEGDIRMALAARMPHRHVQILRRNIAATQLLPEHFAVANQDDRCAFCKGMDAAVVCAEHKRHFRDTQMPTARMPRTGLAVLIANTNHV